MKTIRKTIAFPAELLEIISRKAKKFGLSTVDFIRFLTIKEAEKEESEKIPHLSKRSEKNLAEALKAEKEGKLKVYKNADDLIASFNLK